VATSDVSLPEERPGGDALRTFGVILGNGAGLGHIHLKHDVATQAWGVQSMESDRIELRNPGATAAVNPPFSASFTTTVDGFAHIQLYDARTATSLTAWDEQIDPNILWRASANFTREEQPFPAYLALTVFDDAKSLRSAVILPLTVGVD
jgi:hypothetical protein